MDTENKNLLLGTLNGTANRIDEIGYIVSGSNLCNGFQTVDWSTDGGTLVNDSNMDFVNGSGSDIVIIGVALFSSGHSGYTDDTTNAARDDAVAEDIFDSSITIQDGETLRLTSYTYTIN